MLPHSLGGVGGQSVDIHLDQVVQVKDGFKNGSILHLSSGRMYDIGQYEIYHTEHRDRYNDSVKVKHWYFHQFPSL